MNQIKRICNSIYYIGILFENKLRLKKSEKNIQKYHNLYQGKRCFIIGNGPSLRVEDLEKLKGEITFGTHRIYTLFGNTSWRPSFYFAQDYKMIKEGFKEISAIAATEKFIGMVPWYKYPFIQGATFAHIILKSFYPEPPEFSDNVAKEFYEGQTVTYMCLQFAVYMGFTEIILLGVDHNYSVVLKADGSVQINEGVKNHFDADVGHTEVNPNDNLPQLDKTGLAYVTANEYAKKHGVKILNATRGGKLEAFERVDFDSISF